MTDPNAPDPTRTPASDYRDHASFQVEAGGHVFTFYPAGSDRLAALLDHIDKAQRTLDVFYYMFQDDDSGAKVRDALVAAAQRGVEVALMIDDFGSDAPREFFDPIVEAGGSFAVFSAHRDTRYLIRNHQKFVIADNARVMTGGANVSNHYYSPPEKNGWCDLGVAIEGEVAGKFTEWFGLLGEWVDGKGARLRRIRRTIRDWDPGPGPVQLLVGGPLVRRSHWAYRFKQDMVGSRRVDLVTAYFAPPRSYRWLMAKVARRGKVRLIAAGKSDIDAAIDLARLYYKKLLNSGAAIFEFQPCKLHMKLLVVDEVSYFGSANLDRRSIRVNVELMVRVEDAPLSERLREFVSYLEDASQRVEAAWYRQNISFLTRLRWRLIHWVSLADYRLARTAAPDDT